MSDVLRINLIRSVSDQVEISNEGRRARRRLMLTSWPRLMIDMFVDTIVEQQKLPPEISLRSRLGASCDVALDRKGFRKVIDHLLENAVHALLNSNWTPTDGRKPTITIRTEHAGPHVRITVSDNGVGIEPGEHDKIFERFYRIKRGEQVEDKGSGLGLAICHEIVRLHGGRIWAESQMGRGATFHLTLQLATE